MTAAVAEAEWSRDYATFMTCDAGDDWMPQAAAQVNAWLREKGFDVNLADDQDLTVGSARLSTRGLSDGDDQDFRIRLTEEGDHGVFTTDVVAHDERGDQDWIHMSVTNSRGQFVNVPRLAKYLMEVLPLRDGRVEFTAQPQLFRSEDVDRLVGLLADEQRHSLVFVAGTTAEDDIPFDKFRDIVGEWTREVAGLAQVVVLDPRATIAFEERVGERFRAPAWTIRTYRPGVDFDDAASAPHHRMMGTVRLANQTIRRTQYLLGEIARNQAGERDLPRPVQRVRRRFDRVENRRIAVVADPEPPVEVPEVSPDQQRTEQKDQPGPSRGPVGRAKEHVAQLTLVKQFLKLEEITEAGLRDIAGRLARYGSHQRTITQLQHRLEEFQNRIEQLEDRDRATLELLDDQQAETEIHKLYIDDRDAKVRWLEARLKEKGDYEAQWADVPDDFIEQRPESFDDLLDRIEECPGVDFTGDSAEVTKLNAVDTNNAALRVAWDAVKVMRDYVRARTDGAFDGSLDAFINNTPDGYFEFPPGKWAHTETSVTMQGWGDERVFPVPSQVAPNGAVEMKAHFKLAKIGRKTPRMHIYDCHPAESLVCIGYIGSHLTNTHTN